jgi:hypothetical protein
MKCGPALAADLACGSSLDTVFIALTCLTSGEQFWPAGADRACKRPKRPL